ncbi:hypothetical protein IAD21_03523 [Abditibacteriota bacterium]|nr:hypothetical protein IAD21_03523 [Abditibacteriota bacterium]
MKPLLHLTAFTLLMGTLGHAQVAPTLGRRPAEIPTPSRPAIAEPPLGLSILNDKGEVQAVCPLERTEVRSDIAGQMARVVVTQHFSNPSKTPIEALYTFPLPHDAAVDGMTFQIGPRQILGQIKKREEAAQIYQQAKENGQNAALLDQERPNIFSQRVANIVPGQKISVEISFTQPIVYRAGKYEWEFPTVVGPRFVTPATPDADKITPPITPKGTKAGHDLTMSVHLQSAVPLGEITSALHPINVSKQGDSEAQISLQEGKTLPNKDFVLRYAPRDNKLQTGLLLRSDGKGGGWFQLVLQPPMDAPPAQIAPKEMVFVIDQTGSQMGAPIEKAKETMRYCIGNLNPGDTFQLLGFNTDVYPCFPQPVQATAENIQKALDYLKPLAGGGGTDILKAADYALQIPDDPNRPRIVSFMTDGYVGNEGDILQYVREHRKSARMFPFGVGNSVNRYLIDGMAREGRGVPEYALLNEDGQKLASRFYDRVANPVLLDVKADWQGLPVAEVFPKVVPDVFESGPVVLTGRFSRPVAGDLIVSGRSAGKPWSQRVRVDFSKADSKDGEGLPSAWARQKIEDLSNTSPNEQVSGEGAKEVKGQITQVALDYHLMSPYTSFVAVEPTVVNVGGKQQTVEVPVEMADGVSYEGIFGAPGARDSRGILGLMPLGRMSGIAGAGRGGNFGGGGFGGGNGGFGGGGFAPPPPTTLPAPLENRISQLEARPVPGPTLEAQIAALPPEERLKAIRVAATQIAALPPEERLRIIRIAKMSEAIAILAAKTQPETVTVQLWLSPLADDKAKADFAAKLKALGWTQNAVLTPGKLVLGTISSDKLDELAALEGVGLIEVPKFK